MDAVIETVANGYTIKHTGKVRRDTNSFSFGRETQEVRVVCFNTFDEVIRYLFAVFGQDEVAMKWADEGQYEKFLNTRSNHG